MKNLVLVRGKPRSGKTTLAAALSSRGFTALHLDDLYSDFIYRHHPEISIKDLNKLIGYHYTKYVANPRSVFGKYPNVFNEWDSRVINAINSAPGDNIVCEGYTLSLNVVGHFSSISERLGFQICDVVITSEHEMTSCGKRITIDSLL